MPDGDTIRALMVDPSLFTGPYDAALNGGLVASGVQPTWAVRPTRQGDPQEIPTEYVDALFYRRIDEARAVPAPLRTALKGVAHLWGLARLVARVARRRPDVVHFQWLVFPPLDVLAMVAIKPLARIVVTVHGTEPFNGDRLSRWQTGALDRALRLCDALVVHTRDARRRLSARGIPTDKIAVIPHGPLTLHAPLPARMASIPRGLRTFTLFGELKPYKGIDLLLEAAARLPPAVRARARFVVAGRPRMDLEPIRRQIAVLGLDRSVALHAHRLSEDEMATLFAETDCFLFPYRQIDASGVYFLTKSLGKWMIASRVGVFAEDLADGRRGTLIAPENPDELAAAIAAVVEALPTPAPYLPAREWTEIGRATKGVYRSTMRLPAAAVERQGALAGSAAAFGADEGRYFRKR